MESEEFREIRLELLKDKVEPHEWLITPWRCWHELSGDRLYSTSGIGSGMGPSVVYGKALPIPWTAIVRWCVWNRIPDDEFAFVFRLVRAMDVVFRRIESQSTDRAITQLLKGKR